MPTKILSPQQRVSPGWRHHQVPLRHQNSGNWGQGPLFSLSLKKKEKKSLNLPFVSNRNKGEKRKKEERGALTGSSPACNTKPCCAGKPYTAPHPARALPRRSLPPGCFPKPKLPLREAKSQPLLKSLFVWIPFPNQRILRLNSLPPLCRAF